ncbi:hypothetical protein NDI52_03285 [Leptolyngbya sp. PL-A3]|nr:MULTISPECIES: DUF6629 family protein [unclassified Leptolyngbya]MBD1910760.1 hypothetical protein [Leptolyngbya sp. FACHB-8]MBD2158221.1 hypothetical protein [Leptolyngbya sp. FACHB-16]
MSSVLIPAGVWCIQKAWKGDRHYLPLATFPLAFGLQQGIEGLVWVGLGTDNPALVSRAAIGFAFFSHGFWLCWIPLMASQLEKRPQMRRLWQGMAWVGALYGTYLLVPLWFHPDWLTLSIRQQTLDYALKTLIDHPLLGYWGRVLYIATILTPLLLTRNSVVSGMGWLVLGTLLATSRFFEQGFISVWCFFAAIASSYVVYQFLQGAATLRPSSRFRPS